VTKYQNIANSKWQTAAILKDFFAYISAIYCPINAKFCVKKQNHDQTQVVTKIPNFKIQDGVRLPFSKWFDCNISAGNHPISMNFGVKTQILVPRTVTC